MFHLRQSTPCCTPSVPDYTGWPATVWLLCIPSKYVTAGWFIPNLYHTLGVPGELNEDFLSELFYYENEVFVICLSMIFIYSATCQVAVYLQERENTKFSVSMHDFLLVPIFERNMLEFRQWNRVQESCDLGAICGSRESTWLK